MEATERGRLLSGRYRLETVIGHGGMGVVWQGRDELLNRDVAVKEIVFPPHLSEQEQQLACDRATREAQVAARLSHVNVVRVYDIVEEDGHPCIVMELLPYQSLAELMAAEGPLPPARAARIGLGVLAALRAAHREGILHRDVKPANILVGPEGRVVLTDFGIARAAGVPTLTTDGTVVGSPSYMAPERARGGQPGAPADLWGLGAMLYAAVEGRPPFERDGALATLTAVVADEPEPPRHAGPLEPVISGLLRKDPAERLGAKEAELLLREAAADADPADAVPPPRPAGETRSGHQAGPDTQPAPAPALTSPAAPPSGPGLSDPGAPPQDAPPQDAAPQDAPPQDAPPQDAGAERPGRRHPRRLPALLTLAVLAVAGVIVAVLALSSSPRPSATPPVGSRPSASTGSTTATTPAASPPASQAASAPSAGGARTAPAQASGPSTASSAAASGPGTMPAGFYRFTNATGFSIGVPDGWVISHVGHYVYIRDPGNGNIFLLIDQSDQPKPDPLADWQQQAANRASSYPDYHLIRLQSVNYPQAEKAADWEFTYVRDGLPVHILNRNVLANATHAYALYWSAPVSDWNAEYHYFTEFAGTFRPAAA